MQKKNSIALAVAGGGYRATLYSLGALWRLNEFGLLSKLSKITSVSGGSLLTAYIAIHWCDLIFDDLGRAINFEQIISEPIQKFCAKGIDVKAVLSGLISFKDTIGDKIAQAYDKHLFKGAMIGEIPYEAPEFLFYGTNYQTGSSLGIQKSQMYDYKIGRYPNPEISMAKTAAISSAFPPILSPVTLHTNPLKWEKLNKKGLSEYYFDKRLKKKLILADGGLYDNLGLEAVWKGDYSHVISCDAGAPFSVNHRVLTLWPCQFFRMTDLMTDQQRALRKRILIARYLNKELGGAYFSISTQINDYNLQNPMTTDSKDTRVLKSLRTRLDAFSEKEQGQLINWGYALADAAIRKYSCEIIEKRLNKKGKWVIPEYPL